MSLDPCHETDDMLLLTSPSMSRPSCASVLGLFASLDRIHREKQIDFPSPRVAWHEELTLTPEPAAASPINK
jgi:hypothetical protein